MLSPCLATWGECGEIVQGLMVVLKEGRRRRVLALQRGLPSSSVPRPGDPFCREEIADCLFVLRWQGSRFRWISQRGIATFRWFVRTRLVRRLHRIDGIEVRGERAVVDVFRCAFHCRLWGILSQLQADTFTLQDGDLAFCGTLVGIGVSRGAGANEPEMV